MSLTRTIAALATTVALATPAAALATGHPPHPGNGHQPGPTAATPGPDAPAAVKAKAYGRLCRSESREPVAGQKGTPFSRCVTAMAKAANGVASPAVACAGLSHRHTAGRPGTPYSRCVVAATHLADQPAKPAGA
jgi:hypothetical protein